MEYIRRSIEVGVKVWSEFRRCVDARGIKLKFAITEALRDWIDKHETMNSKSSANRKSGKS